MKTVPYNPQHEDSPGSVDFSDILIVYKNSQGE